MTRSLISSLDRPVSARARLLAPAGLAAAFLFRQSLERAGAQETPDAQTLLTEAAQKMTELESFHFSLVTENGETTFMETFTLSGVSGMIRRPDSFYAEAEVDAILATITLKMISIGGHVWVSDPLSEDGAFQDLGTVDFGAADPTMLLNPDRLILPGLRAVTNPVIAGTETIDDVETTRVDGTVDLSAAISAGGTPIPENDLLNIPTAIPFSAWIDADRLVHRVEVTGALLEGEDAGIIRQVNFASFNGPVDIQAPM